MRQTSEFWDREVTAPVHPISWMAHLAARHYINESISGERGVWPIEWFERQYPGLRFSKALSVGCGTGVLERQLVERGIADQVDAFDGSLLSLHVAEREAEAAGLGSRIRYFAWDFNEPHLIPARYDAVFFHQSLHHVAKLEKILRAVLIALKPGGILYLDEMIGPSRTFWTERTIAPWAEIYARIPREHRLMDVLPPPIQLDDPSETIRSGEILEQLRIGFDIEHFRGYGGNVLTVIFPFLIPEKITEELVSQLLNAEKDMLRRGNRPFYAVIVARPKREGRRRLGSWRYFLEPKMRRIGREARGLLTR